MASTRLFTAAIPTPRPATSSTSRRGAYSIGEKRLHQIVARFNRESALACSGPDGLPVDAAAVVGNLEGERAVADLGEEREPVVRRLALSLTFVARLEAVRHRVADEVCELAQERREALRSHAQARGFDAHVRLEPPAVCEHDGLFRESLEWTRQRLESSKRKSLKRSK